jgi:hypothetical protein
LGRNALEDLKLQAGLRLPGLNQMLIVCMGTFTFSGEARF